jgi:hypothetical protein
MKSNKFFEGMMCLAGGEIPPCLIEKVAMMSSSYFIGKYPDMAVLIFEVLGYGSVQFGAWWHLYCLG